MGNKVGWRGGVEDQWEVCGCEYGDRLRRLWRLCDPGVAGGKLVLYRGDQVLARMVRAGECGCVCGMTTGMFNWHKVSCVQKFAFATLAVLIAISMLATHTWRANVGPPPSTSKFVNM